MARILVVDDNEDNRVVLQRMLDLAGHEVMPAQNGQEALTTTLTFRPEVILMDLAMPGMDGWEAIRRLKEQPALRRIPVVVVTGHVASDQIERATAAGCQDVVSKPVDFHVLVEKVERQLTATHDHEVALVS